MTSSIVINKYHSRPFFKAQDFHNFREKYCISARKIELFESLLYPVRTDTVKNFCKDFFSPTLVNCAFKTEGIAWKILMTVVCAYIDLCTLPIRLITLIPRYFYNLQKHPLYQYLLEKDPKLLTGDSVDLELDWPEGSIPKSTKERLFFVQVRREAW